MEVFKHRFRWLEKNMDYVKGLENIIVVEFFIQ